MRLEATERNSQEATGHPQAEEAAKLLPAAGSLREKSLRVTSEGKRGGLNQPGNYGTRIKQVRKRRWSKEGEQLTDDQLVRKARARAFNLPLSVEDLFDIFGIYHNFFWRSILLNTLVWSLGGLQSHWAKLIPITQKDFQFSDEHSIKYTNHREFESFPFPNEMADAQNTVRIFSHIFGPFYVLFRANTARRWLVLETSLIYMLASCLFFLEYKPILRLAVALTSVFNKPVRYVALMHLSESIPARLLPLAVGIMGASESVVLAAFEIVNVFSPTWRYNGSFIGFLVGIAAVFYYFFIPPPILLNMTNKEGNKIQATVTKTFNDPDIIDVDALIDDTIFTARATVSPWKKVWALLRVGNFRRKYVCLLLILTLQLWVEEMSRRALEKKVGLGRKEADMVNIAIQGISALMVIVFVYSFGRRFTIATHVLLSLAGATFYSTIRLEQFDICHLESIPNATGKALSAVWAVICVYCARILSLTVRMTFIQHIPVEEHTLLFSIGMICINAAKNGITEIFKTDWAKWEGYPGRDYIIAFGVLALFSPALLFVDNCETMPLISSDYAAYHLHKKKWNDAPRLGDNEAGESYVETTLDSS